MATTFFDLRLKKTQTKKKVIEIPKKEILLTIHHTPTIPAKMTYIDFDGNENIVTGPFNTNSDGSYTLTKTTFVEHPVYLKTESSYIDVDEHYSYIDKDGEKRVFNNLDTLRYNEETNTYTGIVDETEYVSSKVELFTEKN